MPVALGNVLFVLVAVLSVSLLLLFALSRTVKRLKRNMDVSEDTDYAATLTSLSEASVRHFNPYTDVDWEAPVFTVTKNDPRWVLSTSDPLGSHPWYQSQPLDKRVAIGMWRQANMAKVGTQFEGILVRGLLQVGRGAGGSGLLQQDFRQPDAIRVGGLAGQRAPG